MPLILAPADYDRWLGRDPDPADLKRPFPSAHMIMWPISRRANSPRKDDASVLQPADEAAPG